MNLTEAIKNVTKKGQLDELATGGGATGVSQSADPVGGRAKAPGQSNVQGDTAPKGLQDGVTGVEETDPENNTKPTGDMSAQNAASIAAKGSMREHVEAMFAGEELSEAFMERAEALFEAAVIERVNEAVEDLEEQFNTVLSEEVARIEEESQQELEQLVEKLDDYLNHVVEKWLEDNQIALEHSLRTEITEDFINNMRSLFTESYINIPEEKFDVVEQLTTKVQELEDKLNEAVHENIELTNSIAEMACQEAVDELCEGLTAIQADKLRKLSEGVEFDSIDNFKKKVSIIKENYFLTKAEKKTTSLLEESFEGEEVVKTTSAGPMSKYVTAISKTIAK